MTTTVKFENVSKHYNLGLTRISMPAMVSKWVKNTLKPKRLSDSEKQSLWALKDISFELEKGQSLALVGQNGAGKTTLLKLLANITKPTSGQITIDGSLSALIELGAGFHPDLTGRENVYLNGSILGLKRKEIDGYFNQILDFSEIERFIDTPVKRYSSGMMVRLGFAIASCIEPDILLVDEVLAVGDTAFRQKCMSRIQELLDKGTSIIFVSHNLWFVQAVCPYALYIEKGQVKHFGKTSDVIEMYDRDINQQRAQKFDKSEVSSLEQSEGLVEITNVEINGLEETAQDYLMPDQSTEIKVHYTAYNVVGNVNVVIRIIRSDGLTCCMVRNNLDNLDVSIARGTGSITVTLNPLQLRGGSYFVQAMLKDAHDVGTISTGSSDWFNVGGTVLSNSPMNGVFEPNRSWQHDQTPSNGLPQNHTYQSLSDLTSTEAIIKQSS